MTRLVETTKNIEIRHSLPKFRNLIAYIGGFFYLKKIQLYPVDNKMVSESLCISTKNIIVRW